MRVGAEGGSAWVFHVRFARVRNDAHAHLSVRWRLQRAAAGADDVDRSQPAVATRPSILLGSERGRLRKQITVIVQQRLPDAFTS